MSNLKRYTGYLLRVIDTIACFLAYLIAFLISFYIFPGRNHVHLVIQLDAYLNLLLIALVSYYLVTILFLYNDDDFLKRSAPEELTVSFKIAAYVVVFLSIYIFFSKTSIYYSRFFIIVFFLSFLFIDDLLRIFLKKKILPKYRKSRNSEKILIIANSTNAEKVLHEFYASKDWRYYIAGIVLTDRSSIDTIVGIPVLMHLKDLNDRISELDYDSALIVPQASYSEGYTTDKLTELIRRNGKTVEIRIPDYQVKNSYRKLDQFGNSPVLVYFSSNPMPKRQEILRRILNLITSIILLPVFLLFFLIVSIDLSIESPGKVLIKVPRIGKNGRLFSMYRFRTFRMDAEERLQSQQTPYTHIGAFLHKTHLDGLPQILNVFFNDMSFVGPHAASIHEFTDSAETRENIQIMIRPGITGYWNVLQGTGRIRKKENEYLGSWSLVKDLGIILLSFGHYLTGTSYQPADYSREELQEIIQSRTVSEDYHYDHDLYQAERSFRRSLYLFFKRTFDILLSGILIILLSPLLLILAIIISADDGGAPLYAHKRVGKNGRIISVYKFRSMKMDAADLDKYLTPEQKKEYLKEYKLDADPRVTKIGAFMRRTSLDELPQLFNIFNGTMSFIGPRPVVADELSNYSEEEIARILSIRPGLTGYWQAYARNNAEYKTGQRQKMELYYVDHQSFLLDVRIFFHTFRSVLKEEGIK